MRIGTESGTTHYLESATGRYEERPTLASEAAGARERGVDTMEAEATTLLCFTAELGVVKELCHGNWHQACHGA